MHTWQRPPASAAAIGIIVTLALIVFVYHGIGGVIVLAFACLLIASYLAHRYVDTRLGGHYARHGDRMD
jgi:cobalamin synthase